jgi:hypothetical protein
LFLVGAVILVAYGVGNTVGAWIGIATGNGISAATLGHAALWDPLFLIWGLLLGLGLRAARTRDRDRA